MKDPVTARNGETYERASIERLLKGKRRPGSKEARVLDSLRGDKTLVSNWFAKHTITEVRAE